MVDEVMQTVPDPSDPDKALAAVVSLRRLADRLEAASVQAAVDQGWTWVQIAEALGVTKQAVHKKYARRIQRRDQ
jgi:predicted transcriptional regulator